MGDRARMTTHVRVACAAGSGVLAWSTGGSSMETITIRSRLVE